MKKIIIIILAILPLASLAQQKKPKIKKGELITVMDSDAKHAWKDCKQGNKYYKQNTMYGYAKAQEYYSKVYEYNSECNALLYRLGASQTMASFNKTAHEYLEKCINNNENIAPDVKYLYALALHQSNNYAKAKQYYEEFLATADPKFIKIGKELVNLKIKQCENGIMLSKDYPIAIVQNLGKEVNSTYNDYSPIFSNSDEYVYYTTQTNSKQNKIVMASGPNSFEYDKLITLSKPINKGKDCQTFGLNLSGNMMVLRQGPKAKVSFKNGNTFTKPLTFVNKIKKSTSISFNSDTSKILITSYKNTAGGSDIFLIDRKKNGKISKPVSLSKNINTQYDECAAYFVNDTVIYFASNGVGSMGGYDIFKTVYRNRQWQTPTNMGCGMNSGDDEMYFQLIPGSLREGFYASKNKYSNGGYDIFKVLLKDKPFKPMPKQYPFVMTFDDKVEPYLPLEGPAEILTQRLTVVKGKITDFDGSNNIYSDIEIVDLETNQVVQNIKNDATSGEYLVMIPSGKNYSMTVKSEGYMFHSENFNIPQTTSYQEVRKDISLLPIDPGSKVVLNNVFFDTGKSELREESFPELNNLKKIFDVYPKLVVEISGHTDNVGSKSINIKLSQDRAQSVVDYLISLGVNANQLRAKGYGPDQPRDTNATPEGRQNNRRVEAKILER